ncbi:hypothetical protein [Erysipelothrix tonsillarum]|uniref:hypothetical protein n=1 Tax=Erysipelothrix tonsillarum TaxID=38402 RepID=UPI00035D07B6|nr:hypothetical protein [Erysipelothrix tonsillarum]
MLHFGVVVLPGKKGLKLVRENYAIINKRSSLFSEKKYELMKNEGWFDPNQEVVVNGKKVKIYEDEKGQFYTDEWCIEHQKECLQNFDLHINFFASLSKEKFKKETDSFINKFPMFEEVSNLNEYNGKSGYYVMILDEYCQIYTGTSGNIMKRIREHWSQSKQFDRLLYPMGAVERSIMSIDSYRALDTSRIFAYDTEYTFEREDEFISYFSPEFCTNRTAGGRIEGGLINIINMVKEKNL